MDCRTFRKQHLAYVDDTLPGVELVAMQRHLLECEPCAHHDALVRKSLLVARNLPTIEPSADFAMRLAARLEREKIRMRAQDYIGRPLVAARGPNPHTFMTVAAALVGVGYLAAASLDWTAPPGDIALAPVVATQPELPASTPMTDAALVTSFSAGIPVWPVAYFVGQAPVSFAAELTR
jgi:anti-sigma factor RsiW